MTHIVVRCGNPGNQMFRIMLAWAIKEQLAEAEISGFHIPEFGLSGLPATALQRPLNLEGMFFDIDEIVRHLRSGEYDGALLGFGCYALRLQYFGHKLRFFRQLFQETNSAKKQGSRVGDDEIVISVRTGDIIDGLHPDYVPIPIWFYADLLERERLKPVFVGQISSNFYVDALRRRFPDAKFVKHDNWIGDFQTLRTARHIVLSVSTFAWMAAWLSDAQSIHLPVLGFFNPEQRPDIDLIPKDDDRYRFHNFPVLRYKGTPEQKALLVAPTRHTEAAG